MNEPTELPINQKEYLKKYLGIGKAPGEKKKKKKKPTTANRVQIIDDDVEVAFQNIATEEDVLLANEDAPQIVAIIDERPPSLRIDEKTKNPLWQPIGVIDDNKEALQKQMIKGFKIQAKFDKPLSFRDSSPPRRKKRVENEDSSPPRKSASSSLPAEIVIKEERRSVSPSDDISPRRKNRRVERGGDMGDESNSPTRNNKHVEGDLSPPRRSKETNKSRTQVNSDGDISPPRRNKNVKGDSSPPRRGREMTDKRSKSRWDNDRKRNEERDVSPPRKTRDETREVKDDKKNRPKYDDDSSPPRKNRKVVGEISPTRKNKETVDKNRSQSKYDDNSPQRRNRNTEDSLRRKDHSPSRKSRKEESGKSLTDEKRSKKIEKTSNENTSKHGLVAASEVVQELEHRQNQQEKLFNSLSAEASGQNSQTVYRDRQTGKIRNLQEEEERKRKKQEEEQKNKEKYERWGRGLTQVESQTQKLQDQLHEMSKPLARYADDEDLEKYLKEQEREGDPMLAYIRKKKKKKAADAGEVTKPKFEGEFMPNRYGIRPGHRWDGVDRSSGYEKKWFEVQNEKRAVMEDSYKWSTEDM